MTREQFINEIAKYVQKYAPKYGIKVCSPIIAQAVLESGAGTSELAVNANNFFGLKYKIGRCPSASGIYYKVGSEQHADGSYTSSAMQWCKFDSMEMCVKGYFEFISISRYSNLKGVTDPKTYLERIKADGYATSLKYVDNVYRIIETDNLTRFDIKEETNMTNNLPVIALSAGHGPFTAGKQCDSRIDPSVTKEWYLNDRICDKIENKLKEYKCKVVRVNDTTGKVDTPLATRANLSNNANADVYLAMHHNAGIKCGSGGGTIVYYYSSKAERKTQAQALYNAIVAQTGLVGNRSSKVIKHNFYECRVPKAPAFLVENGFMDSVIDTPIILTEAHAEKTAVGVVNFLVNYLKLAKSGIVIPPTTTNSATSRSYLMKGDKGQAVKDLQTNLNYIGYDCGTVDGDFGDKTDKALRKFQSDYKLTVDGKYGATSKKTLEDAVAKKKAFSTTSSATKPIVSVSGGKYIYNGLDYSLVFNPTYYANKYSDLKNVFGTNATKLFEHFCQHGMMEKRQGSANFDVVTYKNRYADLQKVFGENYPSYYKHYVEFGSKEGRSAI